MNRYSLEVFIENKLIFYMEFRSITSVAETIDRFIDSYDYPLWFEVTDILREESISVKDLMNIWHS